ncbi:histone-lysine N-methyltransferase ASHH1 isoform X3 [Magnolia sinica]|uniref:histone-lysine N-methyltransferase ASHH1 isoform X3 n=1 Tax=Magnolia sinica TaxID=86752 RepID=UPI002659C87B|nr:histone-lysine N-methyltransferase ASHH1 isoform X3 [Magnolia sinica]
MVETEHPGSLSLGYIQDQLTEVAPHYKRIERNEFSYRKHKKQKEEDMAICICQYDANHPDSACGDRCLNVLTSTECTPGYCPCDTHCKNQAGQFIIEYCGEVISWKEARRRSQAYEAQGLKDAFIISLNAYESIDATRKGSLARFINHSCQPNCETRKWTVLGEIRVGIFAKQDILAGTELAYDYNFEWYGGAKVRCLCGASLCSGFLGAKSRGFQEDTYLWEDDDDRYSVENVPLYDSEEDEQTSKLLKTTSFSKTLSDAEGKHDHLMRLDDGLATEHCSHLDPIVVEPLNSILMEDVVMDEAKTEVNEDKKMCSQDAHKFSHKNAMISRIRSNSACRNYYIQTSPLSKKSSPHYSSGRSKHNAPKQFDAKLFGQRLASKEALEEVLAYEQARNLATSQLDSLYNEIRPAIEEHEKDSQDSVSTTVAEKWIEASCCKLKEEFNLYSAVIKHASLAPQKTTRVEIPLEGEGGETELKYLKMD